MIAYISVKQIQAYKQHSSKRTNKEVVKPMKLKSAVAYAWQKIEQPMHTLA